MARDHLKALDIQFDDAYALTSERASDTLEILTDIPYKHVKALREWLFGSYEGKGEHLNPPLPYNDFFVQFGGESQQDITKSGPLLVEAGLWALGALFVIQLVEIARGWVDAPLGTA